MAGPVGSAVRTIWWLVLIRGILLVLLGIFTLWNPIGAVWAIVVVFGIYAIVDGITAIIAGIATRRENSDWGWYIAQGVLSIIAGALVLALPGLAGLVGIFAILWFIVVSLFIGGIVTLVAAARQSGGSKAWGIVAGIIDLLFAVLLAVLAFMNPVGTAAAIVWVVAIVAIVFGVFLIVTSFGVRKGAVTAADRFDEASRPEPVGS